MRKKKAHFPQYKNIIPPFVNIRNRYFAEKAENIQYFQCLHYNNFIAFS